MTNSTNLNKRDIVKLLESEGEERRQLFEEAANVKSDNIGNIVFLRGLIEFSNICTKDCLYCGIRRSNIHVDRYNNTDEEILEAARYAYDNNYGSIVMQSGEIAGKKFTDRISRLLSEIQKLSNGGLRVTLSCGEQNLETYRKWFESGASRYLLRIETTNRELYYKLHPNDERHSFENRIESLYYLKSLGYQLGTGVMIGLPFQTKNDLANDLIWMKKIDVDMVGMGPYLEHKDTPLYNVSERLLPLESRFTLSIKMIAILRILMKDINIAASTAMQTIDKLGREKAIKAGANVFMPNITPKQFRDSYKLYDNKPCTDEAADDCKNCIEARITLTDNEIAYGKWGDSLHYRKKSNIE
jgi:biotin synthase